MNVPIILAGGVGSRVGADRPKQFIDILGKPVLVYTIEAFQNHPEIDAIEVVCIKSHIDYLNGLVEKYNLDKVKWITPGGEDFQHSVINGVNNLKGKLADDDIVLVHYGASPFVSEEIITDAIRVAKEKGNSSPAISSPLLLGSNDGEKSLNWIDRDQVMILNSPQCFKFKYVCELYDEAIEKDLIRIRDTYGDARRTIILNVEKEKDEPIEVKTITLSLTNKNNLFADSIFNCLK